jgi:transcriptional regulator with XRE-family HTH domain
MDTLVARMKALRLARGWSQLDLALKSGFSPGYIARLETQRHDPKLSTIETLARTFRVSVAALFTERGKGGKR